MIRSAVFKFFRELKINKKALELFMDAKSKFRI